MKFSQLELPSNRKFGFFFTFIFSILAVYFYNVSHFSWSYTFGIASSLFLVATLTKAEILLPLNKLWMRLGIMLSLIVGPIVLGIIFFGIFTPIACTMRLCGRDELRLKLMKQSSHWILRNDPIVSESFKRQF